MANTGIYEDDCDSDSSILGVDSDVESNFDSPADGYFSERPHPRETFVENSSISAAAEAKARERAEERASSSMAVPPSQSSSPTSPTRSLEWTEETPLVNQEAPPPDYESAISSPPSTQGQGQRYLAQSGNQSNSADFPHSAVQSSSNPPPEGDFTASGMPLIAQVVTFGRNTRPSPETQPQSMRDAAITPVDEESGLLTGLKSKKRKRRWFGGCCKSMSVCNIILFAAIVILVIIVAGAADDRSESDSPKEPHEGDGDSSPPSNPVMPPKQPANMPPSTRQCPYDWYSQTRVFDFPRPSNFSLVELMESSNWVSDNIRGKITVGPAQKEQGVDIRISVNYATTSPWRVVGSNYIATDDSFVLQLPVMKKSEGGGSQKPCLYVNIDVSIRPGVVLEDWELSTGNLAIEVKDGLFNRKQGEEALSTLRVAGSSTFNAIRGNTDVEYWPSRRTEIYTISGSIRGTFALLDLLSITSQSGSINANVDPREADEKNPREAEFITKSHSGSVKIHYPQEGNIPEREYSTRVETTFGSVSGEFIMGTLTSLHSLSGTISAQLLPYFDPKRRSTLHTDTRSGTTKLHVLQPFAHPGEQFGHNVHKSTSTSGTIDVLFPDEWSGMIDEQSISGSLSAKGKGVRVISDGGSLVEKHLIAQKGYGEGEMTLKTTSGSIKARFGKEW